TIDSCSARKLEPGLEAMYSKPRDLMTSTMKSEPAWSTVITSTLEGAGSASFARTGAVPECGGSDWRCACTVPLVAMNAAALPAAPFRKLRRSTGFFLGFAIVHRGVCSIHQRWLPLGRTIKSPARFEASVLLQMFRLPGEEWLPHNFRPYLCRDF